MPPTRRLPGLDHPDPPSRKRAKTLSQTRAEGNDEGRPTINQDESNPVQLNRRSAEPVLDTQTTPPGTDASRDLMQAEAADSTLPLAGDDRAFSLGDGNHDTAGAGERSDSVASDSPEALDHKFNLGVGLNTIFDQEAPSLHALIAKAWGNLSEGDVADDPDNDGPRYEFVDPEARLCPRSARRAPLRPTNPYTRGKVLLVRPHKACSPFGSDYPDHPGIREFVLEENLRTKALVELCLEHPPMEGETAWDDAPKHLRVVDTIRVKDGGGAQLVTCSLDDGPDDYVAKIYDPLYYGLDSNRMWSDSPRDVAFEADQDYCCEVAAYLELDEAFGGKEIPKYHGSWTFQMPLGLPDGTHRTRDIRMILIERIRGRTMIDVMPDPFPDTVRLEVLAQLLETIQRMVFAGVSHGDISQRNIMLYADESAKTIGRVVITDFNNALVFRLDRYSLRHPFKRGDKPPNPIDFCWDCGFCYGGFDRWFPESWDYKKKPMQEWLYERWGTSQEFRPPKNAPLVWDDGKGWHRYMEF